MNHQLLDITQQLGWVLLHSLWQGALIAGILVIALRLVHSAHIRHLLSITAMTSLLTACIVTFFWTSSSTQTVTPDAAITSFDTTQEAVVSYDKKQTVLPVVVKPVSSVEQVQPVAPSHSIITENRQSSLKPTSLLILGGSIWLVGFLFCIVKRLHGLFKLKELKGLSSEELPENLKKAAYLAQGKFSGAERVLIRICDKVSTPLIHGIVKPVIYLPMSVATSLSISELDLILTHELAHWSRRDTLLQAWQLALDSIFFYHPALLWMSRTAKRTREEATDDLVLSKGASRQSYARVLANLATIQVSAVPEASLAATGNHLASRIRRFLNKPEKQQYHVPSRGECFILSITAATVLVCSLFTPNAAQAQEEAAKVNTPAMWYTDFTEARKVANKEGKPLFLFFDMASLTKDVKQKVLTTPKFSKWAKENVVLVEVSYPGTKRLPEALKKQNAQFYKLMGIDHYKAPRIHLITPDNSGSYGDISYKNQSVENYIHQLQKLLEREPKGNYNIDQKPLTAEVVKPRKEGTYLIWRVGSMHTPDEIPNNVISSEMMTLIEAQSMDVELQSFPYKGFEEIYLEAFKNGQQADLLVTDNGMILDDLENNKSWSMDRVHMGEVYLRRFNPFGLLDSFHGLSRSSAQFDISLKMAQLGYDNVSEKLSVINQGGKQSQLENSGNVVQNAKYDAMTEKVLKAYMHHDADSMKTLSSKNWLGHFSGYNRHLTYEAQSVKNFTHERKGPFLISYANVRYTATNEKNEVARVGIRFGLVVYIRENDEWKVINANTHPSNLLRSGEYAAFNDIVDIAEVRNTVITELKPATQLAVGQFSEYRWDQSSSADLMYEILEVVDKKCDESYFRFVNAYATKKMKFRPSARSKRDTSLDYSPDGWRVWSIDKLGNVVFSKPYF